MWQIRQRWDFLSYRKMSECLLIDRRTLSKLDHRHPDGSLELETLDRIYGTLICRRAHHFTPAEAERERLLLVESRMRVLMCQVEFDAMGWEMDPSAVRPLTRRDGKDPASGEGRDRPT